MKHDLPVIIASFGVADKIAAIASGWLSRSPLLTDKEQRLYRETIVAQERAHGETSAAWAVKLGWEPQQGITPHAALAERDCLLISHLPEPLRTAHTLATLRVVEQQAERWFTKLARVFRLAAATRPMASDYLQIAQDESMHVWANKAITARLAEKDPTFRRMEHLAFQAARRVYAPLVLENVVR